MNNKGKIRNKRRIGKIMKVLGFTASYAVLIAIIVLLAKDNEKLNMEIVGFFRDGKFEDIIFDIVIFAFLFVSLILMIFF